MGILKRCILCMVCVVLCAAVCIGCGENKGMLSAKEITDIIKSNNASDIVWTALTAEDISAYFGFSDEKVKELSVFINDDDEHFDIAAAVVFETSEDMLAVVEPLNKSLTAAEESFKNINVAEGQKIANKLLLKNGSTLVIVISNNYEKIKDELAKYDFVSVEK